MNKKLDVVILCGGQSSEHEVSIMSSKNVIQALDKNKYDVHIVLIAKSGGWYLFNSAEAFLNHEHPHLLINSEYCEQVNLCFGEKYLMSLKNPSSKINIDLVFPVLHGVNGEDGSMQGLLELMNIPYVGAGILGSAICMDKDVTKRLLRAGNVPVVNWITLNREQMQSFTFEQIKEKLGLPFFVKPANAGSSVGISKVKNAEEFAPAVDLALQFDHTLLFEEFIPGREIECAVLGNGSPQASLPGEIIPHHEFYTYEAKYLDANGAELVAPAQLSKELTTIIQELATKAYQLLCCDGMARIDFFVTENNTVYLNEANTIPGFTQISMYPRMWMTSGISYADLLDKLIDLALQRFKRNHVLITHRPMQSAHVEL